MPTFTSIIDADHDAINTAAQRLSRLLRTPTPANATAAAAQRRHQLALLHDVTWRLIRHDLSEELVMRPAMIAHMGPAGLTAAQHDREDHDHARATLLELYAGFASASNSSTASSAKDTSTAMANLTDRYLALMRELAEHMRRESGEEMPALEAALGRRTSEELGVRYAATLVVTPELVVRGKRVWRDVGEYVAESKEGLLGAWREVQREQEEQQREVREGDEERWRRRRRGTVKL